MTDKLSFDFVLDWALAIDSIHPLLLLDFLHLFLIKILKKLFSFMNFHCCWIMRTRKIYAFKYRLVGASDNGPFGRMVSHLF